MQVGADYFWSRVDRSRGPGACWPWQQKIGSSGYGVVYAGKGREARTHRVAFELTNGAIPVGLSVLHHCDNRPCCNPTHLFLGSAADNSRDMVAKGRARNHAMKQPPTHCPQGHAYSESGMRTGRAQKLSCRVCVNARSRAYQAAQREEARHAR